jgi:hypothetical protein
MADGAHWFYTDYNASQVFSSTVAIKAAGPQLLMSYRNASDTEVANVGYDGGAYFGGKVGIGTTKPLHTLDVSGSLRVVGTHAAMPMADFVTSATFSSTTIPNGLRVWVTSSSTATDA